MRVSFVMLGLRDHRTGGYDFNTRVADALESRGHTVDRVHHGTIPPRARGGRIAGSWEVLRRVVAFRPDILVVARSYTFMVPLGILLVFWRLPVLYLVHHLEWMDSPLKPSRARQALVKWLVGRGDMIWCNSRATLSGLSGMGLSPAKLRVIPPGFARFDVKRSEERFHGKPVLLCVGALTARKGQETVLRACAMLGGRDFHLVLAGSGAEEPGYARRVAEAAESPALRGKVSVRGHLDKEEVYRLMGEADVLVHAAPWEAYGIALAEAMWAGLPVVASRGGAVPELVTPGDQGFLYDPGDARGLSEKMILLLDNEELRVRMGAAARLRAEELYTWDRTCEEFVSLVEETACGQVRRNVPCGPGVATPDR
jgi:glycosyltransferase involved in cell wall biosynthesis